MKSILSLLIVFQILFVHKLSGQEISGTSDQSGNIKLFVGFTDDANKDLSETLKSKLKARIIQLVNQTGIADVGYSNFLLYPEFYINSSEVNETGVTKLTVVRCELNLFIGRIMPGQTKVAGGVYASLNKRLSGSGNTQEAAINNAITGIRSDDKALLDFLSSAKKSIADYFNKNCDEVLGEADRLYNLEKYNESISLFFSIPSTAPCYETARNKSIAVYKTFLNNECKSDLVELKSVLAMAGNSGNKDADKKYDDALIIFKRINPTTVCYEEAMNQITKIETKFDTRQKEEWQQTVKMQQDSVQVQKQLLNGIDKVANQSSAPSNNIIFIKGDK